jgi:hypothetical protein
MSIASAIRRMLDAGFSIEQALLAADVFETESQVPPYLDKRQARNARYYAKKASEKRLNSDDQDVSDAADLLSSPEGSSPTPPSPKPLQSIPPSPPKGGSSPADFEIFWAGYPHKVGKRDAEKAFSKAIKRIDLAALMAGLHRYAAKTDDRPWCNPATWLNQDRWTDMPATQPAPQRQAQAPPQKSAFRQQQDEIYQRLKRETGDRDDDFTGTTLDIGPGDYRPH